MPVYEYRCQACEHEFEEWQKMSDAPVRTCPKCKKKRVEKLISMSSFSLKGGGWYKDLYSSSKPGGADSGSEPSGKADAKAETKAEAKSDAKSETKSETKADAKTAAKDSKKKSKKAA